MLEEFVEVIQKGDDNGNRMPIRLRFPSGLEILGLPTENNYGGEWDLGPTWNYLVLAERPFLLDTGKAGMVKNLIEMIEASGISINDIESVVISHGHEDHDGGLFEFSVTTGTKIRAHEVYDRLIRPYPKEAPDDAKRTFPAACWHCFMPPSHATENCYDYQRNRTGLHVEPIDEGNGTLGKDIQVYHLPGHSPDALALLIESQTLLVGDTLLPEITPMPTQQAFFSQVKGILPPKYHKKENIYGLQMYIRSLRRLEEMVKKSPQLLILPAHRLFYDNHWNEMDPVARIHELIQHHLDRCADILKLLKEGPKNGLELAKAHFDEKLLKGFGILMAENEILSHCELLNHSGDVLPGKDGTFKATGSSNFFETIENLNPLGGPEL